MRPRWGVAVVVATALLGAAAAAAAVTDKVRIGGSNTTRLFSSASFVVVTSPPELDTRAGFDGNSGGWQGPLCQSGNIPRSPAVAITWSVGFHAAVAGPEQAARNELTFDWTTVEQGPVAVSHVVAGRRVGTLPGFFVVT